MATREDVESFWPRMRVDPPGPESERLLNRQGEFESNARTYPRVLPIALDRGDGSYLTDVDGNVYIDFLTGAGSLPLGHSHPEIVEAVKLQAENLMHGLDFPTRAKDEFTNGLLLTLPESMRASTVIQFCGPTGANAVDAAIKLCKTATGRDGVAAFHGAFHGSTHSAMSVSGLVSQKEPIGNSMHGVHFFPFPSSFCALGEDPSGSRCLNYFERVLTDPYGGVPLPACVIVETVQGEGGVNPCLLTFLRGLRRVTLALGIPLIVDEIMCGYGRTGDWWAFEGHGIVPDMVLASKMIGGGLPVSVVMYDSSFDVWKPGAHTGTFRGDQLAFAAGSTATRVIFRDNILVNVQEQGDHILQTFKRFRDSYEFVVSARGEGLMVGLEVEESSLARRIRDAALKAGLILELGGRNDTVIRFLPALNVDRETVDAALSILHVCLESAR